MFCKIGKNWINLDHVKRVKVNDARDGATVFPGLEDYQTEVSGDDFIQLMAMISMEPFALSEEGEVYIQSWVENALQEFGVIRGEIEQLKELHTGDRKSLLDELRVDAAPVVSESQQTEKPEPDAVVQTEGESTAEETTASDENESPPG